MPLLSSPLPLPRSAVRSLRELCRGSRVVGDIQDTPEEPLRDHAVARALRLRRDAVALRRLQSVPPALLSAAAASRLAELATALPPDQLELAASLHLSLAVEGGGMRGCVSAGMAAALSYLGYRPCFDSVHGSSAGALIGAYFVAGQLPWEGPEVYYDHLTVKGRQFIDEVRVLRAVGLGLLDPRLYKDVLLRRDYGKPVFKLDYLLSTVVRSAKPLDFDRFQRRQETQPLRVVASGLESERAVVLSEESGNFGSLEALSDCLWASMLLPGIAGPPVRLREGAGLLWEGAGGKMLGGGEVPGIEGGPRTEPLADALL
ncbi:hypothetical protein TeGR_g49 [Tetraparma gracilis]|uniref:PNPLA domain-containing protein n=1 Tax=Tetraparma gracilis TaxID=2962635 RepID=A0ABQ6NCH4_9STRA|nr:hypothetical protein TeGR_g49 [Tetraparma gracilis]